MSLVRALPALGRCHPLSSALPCKAGLEEMFKLFFFFFFLLKCCLFKQKGMMGGKHTEQSLDMVLVVFQGMIRSLLVFTERLPLTSVSLGSSPESFISGKVT